MSVSLAIGRGLALAGQLLGDLVAPHARLRQIRQGRLVGRPLVCKLAFGPRQPRRRVLSGLPQFGARPAFLLQLPLGVRGRTLKIAGRALKINGDRLLPDHLRFEPLAVRPQAAFELFPDRQQVGLLTAFELGLFDRLAKVGADGLFLLEGGLRRFQRPLGRVQRNPGRGAKRGDLLVRLSPGRHARLQGGSLGFFGGDAREV